MEPVEVQPSPPSSLPAPVATSLDIISKSVAAFAILLYGCGYLITSIYYSSYGFTETSPLRPRIVAAGAWFLLLTLVPFALVMGVLRSNQYLKADARWWFKTPTFVWLYCGACGLFASQARWIFDFDAYTVPVGSTGMTWRHWATLALILLFSIFVGLALDWMRIPRSASAIYVAVAAVLLVWSFGRDLFVRGYFGVGAVALWFFAVGIAAYLEMHVRSWKLKLGDWSWSTVLLLGALLVFASFYYPHLKSSWGGGRPIPVTIYFTKDSVLSPGQSVNALLIDESDSGLYVVGKGDKRATFIPHNSVGLVYFSDDVSDFSLSKQK